MGVPTHYVRLLGARRLHARDRAQECASSSPARRRCSRRPSTRFEARTGQRILERYGMTETGMNASNPLHGERRAGTVGPALPGVELRVADDAGRVLAGGRDRRPRGARARTSSGATGGMPEKTREEFRADGFFITGDIARIDGGRLRHDRRPRQGPDHLGRPQRLSQGDRERDRRARRASPNRR